MINIIQEDSLLKIEISEAAGIEDSSILKNELQNALESDKEISIVIKDESPLHISLYVVIFSAALEANKKNITISVTDNTDILEGAFNNLGLKKNYSEVIQKLKDRG